MLLDDFFDDTKRDRATLHTRQELGRKRFDREPPAMLCNDLYGFDIAPLNVEALGAYNDASGQPSSHLFFRVCKGQDKMKSI